MDTQGRVRTVEHLEKKQRVRQKNKQRTTDTEKTKIIRQPRELDITTTTTT